MRHRTVRVLVIKSLRSRRRGYLADVEVAAVSAA
jgi:hypothetical protein